MKKLDEQKTGIFFGFIFGMLHFLWSLLVAFGLSQGLLDWIIGLHFLNNPFQVNDFSIVTAVTLVVFTSIVGGVFGWMFAYVWNKIHK